MLECKGPGSESSPSGGSIFLGKQEPEYELQQPVSKLDKAMNSIISVGVVRRNAVRAKVKLVLQIESMERRYRFQNGLGKKPSKMPDEHKEAFGETVEYLKDAIKPIQFVINLRDKEFTAISKNLPKPVVDWWMSVFGLNIVGLCLILAETGNLSKYANPAKVFKRLCCGNLPDGTRQHKTTDKDLAILMGYSPERRSVSWLVTNMLLMKKGYNKDKTRFNPYFQVYEDRKAYEEEQGFAGAHAEKVEKDYPTGGVKRKALAKPNRDRVEAGRLPLFILNMRAKRYTEKRLLKHLWQKWSRATKNGLHVGEYGE